MKKRSCRMTDSEKIMHRNAIKIRKMTDEQLDVFTEDIKLKAYEKGRADAVRQFLTELEIKSGTGNGIGASTVRKVKDFAVREGFIGG